MVLKVKARYSSYELRLRRKITVILGQSGSGKTTLLNAVREQEALGAQLGYKIMLLGGGITESVAVAALTGWRDFDICLFDCDELNINKFAGAINKAQIPFVMLSRDKVSAVPIHYDAVYELVVETDNVTRLERVFHPHIGLNVNLPAIVEDSGIGYKFYSSLFNGRPIIATAKGFGGIATGVNNLLAGGHRNVQIIADAATFGCCCGDIEDLDRVTCFLPECFEELLAESKMFRRFGLSAGIDPLSQKALEYMSLERMYEKEVGLCLANNAHIKYEKNGAAAERCLLGSCVGCNKAPYAFNGNDLCHFFSLYQKPNELAKVAVGILRGERPSHATNYLVYEGNKPALLLSHDAVNDMLVKAKAVSPSALTGDIPEKQVWSESGKLIAVKVRGRWHKLLMDV